MSGFLWGQLRVGEGRALFFECSEGRAREAAWEIPASTEGLERLGEEGIFLAVKGTG